MKTRVISRSDGLASRVFSDYCQALGESFNSLSNYPIGRAAELFNLNVMFSLHDPPLGQFTQLLAMAETTRCLAASCQSCEGGTFPGFGTTETCERYRSLAEEYYYDLGVFILLDRRPKSDGNPIICPIPEIENPDLRESIQELDSREQHLHNSMQHLLDPSPVTSQNPNPGSTGGGGGSGPGFPDHGGSSSGEDPGFGDGGFDSGGDHHRDVD